MSLLDEVIGEEAERGHCSICCAPTLRLTARYSSATRSTSSRDAATLAAPVTSREPT